MNPWIILKSIETYGMINTDTQFIQSDIYELENKLTQSFNIIYNSYGAITWLPDLDRWARIVSRFLKSTGEFVMVEFHPALWMFSDDFSYIKYDYFNTDPVIISKIFIQSFLKRTRR